MIESVRPTVALVLISLTVAGGCRQKMVDQPRYEPYEASRLFGDSMAMRQPVEGTVPREALHRDSSYFAASQPSDTLRADAMPTMPFTVTRTILERGRERFNIYCAPCHGRAGDGRGIIVQRGLSAPPSFHTERLRAAPDGHFYQVITNGFGAMFSYASRMAPEDRWAIVAYVRALQLSQNAPVDQLPADTMATSGAP